MHIQQILVLAEKVLPVDHRLQGFHPLGTAGGKGKVVIDAQSGGLQLGD